MFPTSVLPSPGAVGLFESDEEGEPRSLGVCVVLQGLFPRGGGAAGEVGEELVAYRLVFPAAQNGGRASCFSALCSSASDAAALQRLQSEAASTFGVGLSGGGSGVDGSSSSVAMVAAPSEAVCATWTRQNTLVLGLADGSLACAKWEDNGWQQQQQQYRAASSSVLPRLSFLADESRLGKIWSSLRGRGTSNPIRALTVLPAHDALGRWVVQRVTLLSYNINDHRYSHVLNPILFPQLGMCLHNYRRATLSDLHFSFKLTILFFLSVTHVSCFFFKN